MRHQAANTNATIRDLRLDPFALPVRYSTPLSGALAEGIAAVYLDRDRVIVKRPLGGVDATVTCPVRAFRGVAVRMTVDPVTDGVRTTIELMHRDPDMSLPLVSVDDLGNAEDVAADWQAWGKALDLPLLIVEGDGGVREAMARPGALGVAPAKARRMVSSLTRRRPRFLKRRKTGVKAEVATIEGREIIARD